MLNALSSGNWGRALKVAFVGTLIGGTWLLASPEPAPARPTPESFADLAERLLPSVVNISSEATVEVPSGSRAFPNVPPGSPLEEFLRRFEFPGQDGEEIEPQTRQQRSLGSGFVVDPSGFIVTNNHVIDGADTIVVQFTEGEEFDAEIIGRDPLLDVALLKIDADRDLPAVSFGDSDSIRVGDWVMAIGNPFGLGGSVTAGILSARHREINAGPYDDFLQTDASINRGNSGGPMFNMDGRVIGINTAIFSPTGGNVGIGFAIPSNQAINVIEQLKEKGRVDRGWLGVRIQSVTDDIAASMGLKSPEGAIVSSVNDGGPADKAGLEPGDIIVDFDGHKIRRSNDLPPLVADTAIGKTVELRVIRSGKPRNVKVTLGRLPEEAYAVASAAPEQGGNSGAEEERSLLGMDLRPLTPELRSRFNLEEDVEGVLVVNLDRGSDAAQKGLRPGDVISQVRGRAVRTPADIASQVEEARGEDLGAVLLWVYRGGDYFHVAIKLENA